MMFAALLPSAGALSDRTSLQDAMQMVPVAVALGGLLWLVAARFKPAELTD